MGWAAPRKRKLVQWGLACAAAAWVLLQVIGLLLGACHRMQPAPLLERALRRLRNDTTLDLEFA